MSEYCVVTLFHSGETIRTYVTAASLAQAIAKARKLVTTPARRYWATPTTR
jgi:hypothetical protein